MRSRLMPLLSVLMLMGAPAQASVRLGVGADWWVNTGGIFSALLALDTPIVRRFSVGGRLGFGIATPQNSLSIPIDLLMRLGVSRVYLEGLVGPWILVNHPNPVRAHAALGLGLSTGGFELGLEGGWLDSAAIFGLRLGARL